MTRTILILAAALALPASAALAQAAPDAGHGALAGRSPHKAYRSAAATPACGKTMHSLPAGKLPVYGTKAVRDEACTSAVTMARADDPSRAARD